MKQITLLALMLGMSVGAFAQTELEPCCGIVGINPATNTITSWNKTTGRLFQFKVNATDIKTVKLNSPVNATPQLNRITSLNGAVRNYTIIKTFAEPVGKTNINYAEPVGLTNLQINNAEPCCSVIDIQIDNSDPVNGIVTARNKTTGKNIQFKAPALVLKSVNIGDPAYIEPCCNMAIVQVNTGAETQAYGYYLSSGEEENSSSDKWVITPVSTMKGVLGGLDINFPGVERSIIIRRQDDDKFITSVSRNDKSYTISPGVYRFVLTEVPVDNVPIKKGHVTRLKAGFLNIVSEGDWHLYDDTKEKAFASGNKPKRIALPIGSYQLKLGQEFYPVLIKDGKTAEY